MWQREIRLPPFCARRSFSRAHDRYHQSREAPGITSGSREVQCVGDIVGHC